MIATAVKVLRVCGHNLDAVGRMLETSPYIEKLQPSLRAINLGAKRPVVNGSFVAPTASVIGSVNIGSNSSIWYSAIVRGDVNSITIGDFVTIGDRAMIHCTSKHATTIGDRAIVGSGAICHGCTIEVESVVGVGAQVMDGAIVRKHAMVGPGSLVSPGKVIPTGQLWSGVPAVFERDLTEEEISNIYTIGEESAECAVHHAVEAEKTWQTIESEEYDDDQIASRSPSYYKRLTEEQWAYKMGDLENHDIPGRVLDSRVSARTAKESRP